MATPTMMWVFIVGHVVALVVLGYLLGRMEVTADAELEAQAAARGDRRSEEVG